MNITEVVALVTGGASGLGEATVLELARHGAKVAVVDMDAAKGEKLVASAPDHIIFAHADVTGEYSVRQAVKKPLINSGK